MCKIKLSTKTALPLTQIIGFFFYDTKINDTYFFWETLRHLHPHRCHLPLPRMTKYLLTTTCLPLHGHRIISWSGRLVSITMLISKNYYLRIPL